VGNLAPGQSDSLELVVTVNASLPDGMTLKNTAVVAADQPDPNLANNTVVVHTTVRVVDTAPPTCKTVSTGVDREGRQLRRVEFEDKGSGLARVELGQQVVNAEVAGVQFPSGPTGPMVMSLRQIDPSLGSIQIRFLLLDLKGNRAISAC
jgi:Domain of unknown function DUF11